MSFASKLKSLFTHNAIDEEVLDDLADALIEGDVSVKVAQKIVDELKDKCRAEHLTQKDEVIKALKTILCDCVKEAPLTIEKGKVNVWLVVGVNGVGKTTTIAKLANTFKDTLPVVIAAGDTFRAAAREQLQVHSKKLGVTLVQSNEKADSASVVFDAIDKAQSLGEALVLCDTAGRLHNKDNLMRELIKIDKIATKKCAQGLYKKVLILDATSGQNAFRQAEVFGQDVGADAVVLTKYDSSAKGGVAVSLGRTLGVGISYLCTGEKYCDITPFKKEQYVEDFLFKGEQVK